jgi:hypothetical protein
MKALSAAVHMLAGWQQQLAEGLHAHPHLPVRSSWLLGEQQQSLIVTAGPYAFVQL